MCQGSDEKAGGQQDAEEGPALGGWIAAGQRADNVVAVHGAAALVVVFIVRRRRILRGREATKVRGLE